MCQRSGTVTGQLVFCCSPEVEGNVSSRPSSSGSLFVTPKSEKEGEHREAVPPVSNAVANLTLELSEKFVKALRVKVST